MVANIILCNIFKKSTLSTYIFPVKIVIMRNIDNKIMKNVNNFFFLLSERLQMMTSMFYLIFQQLKKKVATEFSIK